MCLTEILKATKGMSTEDRKELAEKANLSADTIKTVRKRKTLTCETLFRLLRARGVSNEQILSILKSDRKSISRGERIWIKLGLRMSELERLEFTDLVETLLGTWKLR